MIIQELDKLYQRMLEDENIDIPERFWSQAKVAWELTINLEGRIQSIFPFIKGEGKDLKRFREMNVPEQGTRSSGILPYFLCDKAAYFLGLDEKRGHEMHEASRALHTEVLGDVEDEAAKAVLAFFAQEEYTGISEETIAELAKGGLMIFKLAGDRELVHSRELIVKAWTRYCQKETDAHLKQCSVSGKQAEMARLFPTVSGIAGAQSSGASLVSFNKPSFESYRKNQAYNASLSQEVAFTSGTALKYLFADKRHQVRIGDTVFLIWADRPAEKEEALVQFMFDGEFSFAKHAEDSQLVKTTKAALENIKMGERPLQYDAETRFFVLGISPNAARLAVRFFGVSTLGKLMDNFMSYLQDIEIVGVQDHRLFSYLRQVSPLGKAEGVPSTLINSAYQAMLNGSAFPQALFMMLLSRIRSDHTGSNRWDMGMRAAMLKACLVRRSRLLDSKNNENNQKSDGRSLTMALSEQNTDPAYILGRLFAVMEKIQQEANPGINTTITDNYLGSAAITPKRVFANLERLSGNHLTKLRKTNKGLSVVREGQLQDIHSKLDGINTLPKTMDPESQAVFYVAYWQQKEELWKKKTIQDEEADATDSMPFDN